MVNSKAQKAVQESLDKVTGDAKSGIAGIVFVAVDKSGNQIAACPSGRKGLTHDDPMTLDTGRGFVVEDVLQLCNKRRSVLDCQLHQVNLFHRLHAGC